MSWSGDIAQIGNKHIHWNVPEAGGALWTDNMLIPKGGDVYTASVYMNYVYDPKVQGLMEAGDPKRNITGIYYIPPVKGAGEAAKKYDPAVAKQPAHLPDGEDARQRQDLRQQGAEQPEVPRRSGRTWSRAERR